MPSVQEIVFTGVRQSRGPKSDKRDAFALAEMLRIGAVPAKVYQKRGHFTRLAYLAKAYQTVFNDDVRVQNRIKSVVRSRGVPRSGGTTFLVIHVIDELARRQVHYLTTTTRCGPDCRPVDSARTK